MNNPSDHMVVLVDDDGNIVRALSRGDLRQVNTSNEMTAAYNLRKVFIYYDHYAQEWVRDPDTYVHTVKEDGTVEVKLHTRWGDELEG
jgi:hypothetical protein